MEEDQEGRRELGGWAVVRSIVEMTGDEWRQCINGWLRAERESAADATRPLPTGVAPLQPPGCREAAAHLEAEAGRDDRGVERRQLWVQPAVQPDALRRLTAGCRQQACVGGHLPRHHLQGTPRHLGAVQQAGRQPPPHDVACTHACMGWWLGAGSDVRQCGEGTGMRQGSQQVHSTPLAG